MLHITKHLYQRIIDDHFSAEFETGGFIGVECGEICRYYFDRGSGQEYSGKYRPISEKLDIVLSSWEAEGIQLFGILHRHLNNLDELSFEDINFIRELFEMNEWLKTMYFPIVIPGDRMTVYCAKRNTKSIILERVILKII